MRHRLPIVVAVALLAAPATAVTVASGATETTTTSGTDGGSRGGTVTTPEAATTTAAPPASDPPAATPDAPATETTPAPPVTPPATNRPGAAQDPAAPVDPTRLEPDRPATREDSGDRRKDAAKPSPDAARKRADRRKRTHGGAAKDGTEAAGETPAADAAQALLDAPASGLSALSVARFRIPPFLLPIYQAAGVQYGIRWEILAAINEIETDYGRNLSVSTAGALGWMQFMPGTWAQYGVDATGDRTKDPYNPVDAIFAAARYLKAAGGEQDIRKAVFAYNHADWYVDDVMRRAASIASLPADVISSLTGLTLAQLPVYVAPEPDDATTKADDADPDRVVVAAGPDKQWAEVRGPADAPVVAVQDGTVTRRGTSPLLGKFVEIRDAYGNRYTYAGLGTLASEHLVPRRRASEKDQHEHEQRAAAKPAAEAPTAAVGASSPGIGPARPRVTSEPGGAAAAATAVRDDADAGLATPPVPVPTTIDPVAPTPTATTPTAPTAPPAAATTTSPTSAAPTTSTAPTATATATTTATTAETAATAPTATGPAAPTTLGSPSTTADGVAPVSLLQPFPPFPDASSLGATSDPAGLGVPLSPPIARALERVQQASAEAPAEATPAAASDGTIGAIDRYLVRAGGLRRADVQLRSLRVGSKVLAGTVLGRMAADGRTAADATATGTDGDGSTRSAAADGQRAAIRFAIRPAGDGAPRIDPRPIVEGWRLLDDAAVFGHPDDSALVADRGDEPDVGRLLLMSKDQLQRRVLANPSLTIYPDGLADIRSGVIDRRVLATMEYLTANGLKLSISSLKSGHSILSASGNVSAHSYGSAMDIAVVDGTPILGHQGAGSITDRTIRLLLRLQGTSKPNQIISLMTYPGTDNTLAMADHADHIHVGFPRAAGAGTVTLGRQVEAVLAPGQWDELVTRLGRIENPKVRRGVSAAALPAKQPRTAQADAKRR